MLTDSTRDTLTVSWAMTMRPYTGFQIRHTPVGGSVVTSSALLPVTTTSYPISNLLPGTEYSVSLYTLEDGIYSILTGGVFQTSKF